jgi:hypothetical protein
LSFIYSISTSLHENSSVKDFQFLFEDNKLIIKANDSLYLAKEKLKDIERPDNIKLKIIDKEVLPKFKF